MSDFAVDDFTASMVLSSATGVILLVGPVASVVIERLGCRWSVVIGSIISVAGFVTARFAGTILQLGAALVMAGAGSGIVNLAGVVVIPKFFDKQLALAQGIGSAGCGFGGFIMAKVEQWLLDELSWRGAMLVIGGISANLCICGVLFVEPHKLGSSFVLKKEDANTSYSSGDSSTISRDSSRAPLKTPDSELSDEKPSFSENMRLYASLWCDWRFLLLVLSDFLSWLVQLTPYHHLPTMASQLSFADGQGANLVSSLGLFAAGGKIFFGMIVTRTKLSSSNVFIIAQILFGVSISLAPFCATYGSLILFAISFGFLSGCYALMMVITQDALGEENFHVAYGMLLFVEAVGVIAGSPLAGKANDVFGSYNLAFYLSGAVLVVSALLLLPIMRMQRKSLDL
ncbi:unnamed protein product [Oikopleura dioica]|uniref:Major facilitator superfamily (MFS) profile domain-containing protein n=1 Tax=Oikopleura dioica TaxID=34765 RepID=E4WU81_OIKDI|nr:unnamed protein product [Oikopleura dioica]